MTLHKHRLIFLKTPLVYAKRRKKNMKKNDNAQANTKSVLE